MSARKCGWIVAFVVGLLAESAPLMRAENAVKAPLLIEKGSRYPTYIIEPPDILLIDLAILTINSSEPIEQADVLVIHVTDTSTDQSISSRVVVSPKGTIPLEGSPDVVSVRGLTVKQANAAISNALLKKLKDPQVTLFVSQRRGAQEVRGEHLVRPDGTVGLGSYGNVNVNGLTLVQAKSAIERHLSCFLVDPEVWVQVAAYNSKVFYVITDVGGHGQQVLRFPLINETVLEAICYTSGLASVPSAKKIWVARPKPDHPASYQILPVNWDMLLKAGDTENNHQLLPGDRVYINADPFLCTRGPVKFFSPVLRLREMLGLK